MGNLASKLKYEDVLNQPNEVGAKLSVCTYKRTAGCRARLLHYSVYTETSTATVIQLTRGEGQAKASLLQSIAALLRTLPGGYRSCTSLLSTWMIRYVTTLDQGLAAVKLTTQNPDQTSKLCRYSSTAVHAY